MFLLAAIFSGQPRSERQSYHSGCMGKDTALGR